MTCERCGRTLRMARRDYRYTESGLPNVILRKAPVYVCPRHGVQAVVLQGIDRIHGDIRQALLERGAPLSGPEIRFLRKHNRWRQTELAERLGVHKITVAKWESGTFAVSPPNQQRLRLLFTDPVTFQKLRLTDVPRRKVVPPIRIALRRGAAREQRAAVA